MTSRERVLAALNHKEPDRVPIDFGGTAVTTIMVGPYRETCAILGLDPFPVRMANLTGQRVVVCPELWEAFHSDVVSVPPLACKWREGRAYDGTQVLYPDGFRPRIREDGSQVLCDKSGRVVSLMPKGGFFFDRVHHTLAEINQVDEIGLADEEIANFDRPGYWDAPLKDVAAEAKHLRETTDKIITLNFIGHIFQAGQYLRGWELFMMDLLMKPALAEAVLDGLAEAHIAAFDRLAALVGPYIDVVVICDDLGMQNGLWMSPDLYRKIVKPYQAKLYQYIKSVWDGFLLLHSDGSIYPIIPDLIEIGVDILNPVQFTAKDMELGRLKREFGADLTFWGGGFDTQKTLPFGTPQQVEDEVKRHLDIMAPGGGFVFSSVHNVTEGRSGG